MIFVCSSFFVKALDLHCVSKWIALISREKLCHTGPSLNLESNPNNAQNTSKGLILKCSKDQFPNLYIIIKKKPCRYLRLSSWVILNGT